MNKKILAGIVILMIILVLLAIVVIFIPKPPITKKFVEQRFSEFEIRYEEKQAQGYDLTEAKAFAKKAKEAFDRKDYETANKLLDKAFEASDKAKVLAAPIPPVWIYEGAIYETHPYYYDGTFKTLTKQIPSLADLGVKTIWLMPIWKHQEEDPSSAFIYLINDYYKINSRYGTEKDLKELVETVHRYDIKIIFDLVTTCTPPGSVVWNNNWTFRIPLSELQSKAEKLEWTLEYDTYKGYNIVYSNCKFKKKPVKCNLFGRVVGEDVILHHYPFAGWGPAVNRSKVEVIDYFTGIAEYYVREYDIDGWRVDSPMNNWNLEIISGDHSSIRLLRSVKEAITNVRPDAILYAETPSILRLTTIEFADPVLDEISEVSNSNFIYKFKDLKTSEQLVIFFRDENIWYNRTRIRFIETCNEERINKLAPELNKPLIVLISTVPEVPMIQAGQEIGATNQFFSDNPSVDWNKGNYELRNFYQKVFEIRNNNDALKYGSISNVWKSGDSTYAYLRSYEDDNVVVVINFQGKTVSNILNLPFESGITLYDELNDETFVVHDTSNFQISIPAYGSRILVLERAEK